MNAPARPLIVLVRQGDTPIVNTRLAAVAREAFPDHDVVDVDVLAELRRRRRGTWVLACGVAENALELARQRTDPKRAVITSVAFTEFARSLVRRHADPERTRFVLQSQSLFNADLPGVPHVVYTDHVHLANLGYPAFDRRRLMPSRSLRREAALYHRCSAVLVRSTNIRDVLVHGYGVDPHRVAVVGVGPNAPVPSLQRADRAWQDRPWHGGRIAFVGLDWERKGGDVLLRAFEHVRVCHPTARLEIVGPDPVEHAPDGVTFHGRLTTKDVAALLAHSDVFCLPTLAEPFGVVFIEAMLAGLPVVGTRLGAQPDFIVPGRTGELVPANDPDALASTLAQLVGDPTRARSMGRCGAELAGARYVWPQVAARMRHAVDAALRGEPHPSAPSPALACGASST